MNKEYVIGGSNPKKALKLYAASTFIVIFGPKIWPDPSMFMTLLMFLNLYTWIAVTVGQAFMFFIYWFRQGGTKA